jgi:hypothetical protein
MGPAMKFTPLVYMLLATLLGLGCAKKEKPRVVYGTVDTTAFADIKELIHLSVDEVKKKYVGRS